MGLQIITSPDIQTLEYTVIWDIAGLNPIISITNNSAGPNLAATTTWFVVYSPSLTLIHQGS